MSSIRDSEFEDKGIIYSIGENIFNLMIINFLWMVFTLPIITIGASTSAMNYTLIKLRRDEGESVVKNFFRSLKQNFRGGLILGTGMIAVLLILFVGLVQALGSANAGSVVGVVAGILVTLMMLVWLMMFVYIFMVYARFDNSIGRTVINAVYLITKYKGPAFKVFSKLLITCIIVPYVLWNFFPYGVPLIFFFGAAFVGYVVSKEFNEEIFSHFIEED